MKKSFLKTFIVLGLLSIFFCGSFKDVNAQGGYVPNGIPSGYNAVKAPTYNTYQQKIGSRVQLGEPIVDQYGTRINYTPASGGGYAYLKPAQNGVQIMDIYDSAGKKSGPYTISERGSAQEAADNKIIAAQQAELAKAQSGCGITDLGNCLREAMGYGVIAVSAGVGWIATVSGWIFDKVILETTRYPLWAGSGPGDMLYMTWKIVRDFSNLILVFSLLYLGIKTILQGQGFADKKVLVGIIIAAILINFSFMFTKDIVFGVSNTVGLEILKSVNPNGPGATTASLPGAPATSSYSAGIMGLIQPQELISGVQVAAKGGWDTLWAFTGKIILFAVIALMLALVFFCVSIIFIYRFCIFIILIIASPIGFVSAYIPWMNAQGKQWWSQLKQQAIFFPAFALALYVVLSICTTISRYEAVPLAVGDGGASIFGFIFRFLLIMAFMIGLMILPGKMGAAGATMMTSVGNNITKRIRNIPRRSMQYAGQGAASVTARGTRRLVGGFVSDKIGGNTEEKRKTLQLQAQERGLKGSIARQKLRTSEALKNQSYDIRNTKAASKLGIGKGIESYNKAVETKKADMEKRRKKDEKLFGLDGEQNSLANKNAIEVAEGKREDMAKNLKDRKKFYDDAKNNSAFSAAEVARLETQFKDAQKLVENSELEVGKLKNVAEVKSLELMQKRNARLWNTMSATQHAAAKKIEEEMVKKWKLAGLSPTNRSERAQRIREDRDLSNPSGTPPPAPTPPSP